MELIFTPDGDQIRTYDRSGLEFAWDTVTGQSHKKIGAAGFAGGGDNYYWDVEFTPDGRLGATACAAAEVFWASSKLENEGRVYELKDVGEALTGVALNPEGTLLATSSSDGLAKLWNLETGEEIVTISDRIHSLGGVDFSPDGHYLVTAESDGTVSVYDMSIEELMEVARSRLSRDKLTQEECQRYLHLNIPTCVDR